jgi:hypothetical protein
MFDPVSVLASQASVATMPMAMIADVRSTPAAHLAVYSRIVDMSDLEII